jgi:starch synthase
MHGGFGGYDAVVRLIHVTSEASPFAKTGGLGDVLGILPAAQAALGEEVLVIHPWYAHLQADPPPFWIGDIDIPFDGDTERIGIGTLEHAGVRYAFVGHAAFRHQRFYGHPDDARRFAILSRAVPYVAARLDFLPHVVHVHDWHAAAVPAILRHSPNLPSGFRELPSVLSVHNAQHQGWGDGADFGAWFGWTPEITNHLSHLGSGNLLHAGVLTAQRVSTVSPTYAHELRRPEMGFGLEDAFSGAPGGVVGILNGLDYTAFDPARDAALAAPFTADNLTGRTKCRLALDAELGLQAGFPLIGVVSRLADQKGIDLLLEALPAVVGQGWNVALLGSGDPDLEAAWTAAFAQYPGRVAGLIGYDEQRARTIYAGSDVFLIPSRFEPCGLTQMIAMRYGSVPVARATGGLVDTIAENETGFLFQEATISALVATLARARSLVGYRVPWQAMMRTAMGQRFGWEGSAAQYAQMYQEVVAEDLPPPPERDDEPGDPAGE